MEEPNNPVANQPQPQIVYVKEQKSTGMALLLTILFGPLGLLYVSIPGGIVLSILCLLLFWTGIVPIICWIVSIIWAVVGIKK